MHTWVNFDQSIKITLSAIKITTFDGETLIRNILKKIDHHLWKR